MQARATALVIAAVLSGLGGYHHSRHHHSYSTTTYHVVTMHRHHWRP